MRFWWSQYVVPHYIDVIFLITSSLVLLSTFVFMKLPKGMTGMKFVAAKAKTRKPQSLRPRVGAHLDLICKARKRGTEVVQMTHWFLSGWMMLDVFQDGAFKQQGVAWRGCVAKMFVAAITQARYCSESRRLSKLAIWLPLVGFAWLANQPCDAFYSRYVASGKSR